MDTVERNKEPLGEYQSLYIDLINHVRDMTYSRDNDGVVISMREDFGKIGLFASAANFLQIMHDLRSTEDDELVRKYVSGMAMECLLTISWYTGKLCEQIVNAQVELFLVKNKRYGNAFSECYRKDGRAYAFGHLQEKINRICSLLVLDEEAKEEPLIDSYKDLLGYCILTLMEIKE